MYNNRKKRDTLLNLLCLSYPGKSRKELFSKIMYGDVLVNGEVITDPKLIVSSGVEIDFKEDSGYVSRGGIKLEHALDTFKYNVNSGVFIDAGSSTGGFTDCLLKRGAKLVYAVDVGYNQLDFRLRRDNRVIVYERRNIMYLNEEAFRIKPDSAVCDLSFRSLRGAALHILNLVKNKILIALVKPQFEFLQAPESFNGVIQLEDDYFNILKSLIEDLDKENVFVKDMTESPIRGAKGNREFFFLLTRERIYKINELLLKLKSIVFE